MLTAPAVPRNALQILQHPAAEALFLMTDADTAAKAVIPAPVIMTAAEHGNIAREQPAMQIQVVAASLAKATIFRINARIKAIAKAFTETDIAPEAVHLPVLKAVMAKVRQRQEKAGLIRLAQHVREKLYITTLPKAVRADIRPLLIRAMLPAVIV